MPRILVPVVLFLGLIACDEAALRPGGAGRPLAVVDGRPITLEALERRVQALPEGLRPKDREGLSRLLTEMVDVEVLEAESRHRGFAESPAGRAAEAAALAELQLGAFFAHLPGPESVDDEDVARYHREHPERFSSPELRRVIVSSYPTLAAAVAARQSGAGVRGDDLGEVRAPRVTGSRDGDPSAEPGASAAPVAPVTPRVAEAFVRAVFALPGVGAVSPPIAHEGRYWLVSLGGLTAAAVRPLAGEEGNIRRVLAQERYEAARRAHLAALRASETIRIDEDALREVRVVGDPLAYDPAQWKRR